MLSPPTVWAHSGSRARPLHFTEALFAQLKPRAEKEGNWSGAQLPAQTLPGRAAAPVLSSPSFHTREGSCLLVHLILLLCFPGLEPLVPYCPEQALGICVKIRHVRTFALPMVFLFSFLKSEFFLSGYTLLPCPPSLSLPVFICLPACFPPHPDPLLLPADLLLLLYSLHSSVVPTLYPPPSPTLTLLNSVFIFSQRLIEMTRSIAHLIPEILF